MGLFEGLDAEAYDRQYGDGVLFRRIVGYFRPQARLMVIAALGITFTALLDTAVPIVTSVAVDRFAEEQSAALALIFMLSLAALASFSWLSNAIRQALSARAVGAVVLSLREDAIDAVLERDMSFYDTYATGKIVSRVTSDTQALSQVIVLTMEFASRVLQVGLLVAFLFTVDASLTMVLLAFAPFIVGSALLFRRLARLSVTQSRRISATVSAHIQETVSGITVAKTFRQEDAIYDDFQGVNEQSRRIAIKNRYVFSSIFPVLNGLAAFGTAAILYWGGVEGQGGGLSLGEWFLFIQGVGMFWWPLINIASFWSQFQLGLGAGERVFALIDAEPAVVQNNNLRPVVKGGIDFEQMRFGYKFDEPVLSDFSLKIAPGETVALVGHTGSGKSSIAKLIARFYEFQGGALRIDGHDIRDLDLAHYRAQLGMVTQTPFLFTGSVRDNIRYGRPDASDEEVLAVAERVGNGDWIASLRDGLDTLVDERGANLAMGQRQIIALTRVLLQDPAIVILDEATASIDPLTETLIQEGLDVVLADRTSIVIAHRLSTVRNADRIIVLRHGAILEEGDHDALLAAGGHYAELYNTYFRHQSLEYINSQPME